MVVWCVLKPFAAEDRQASRFTSHAWDDVDCRVQRGIGVEAAVMRHGASEPSQFSANIDSATLERGEDAAEASLRRACHSRAPPWKCSSSSRMQMPHAALHCTAAATTPMLFPFSRSKIGSASAHTPRPPRLRCGFDGVDRPLSSAGAKATNVPLVASQVGKARQATR